jgi:hypothetical protein
MESTVQKIVSQLTGVDGDFNAILTHNVELTAYRFLFTIFKH